MDEEGGEAGPGGGAATADQSGAAGPAIVARPPPPQHCIRRVHTAYTAPYTRHNTLTEPTQAVNANIKIILGNFPRGMLDYVSK